MLNPDTAPLGEYTFARLNDMLTGISPKSNERPILFYLGITKHVGMAPN